MPRAYTENQLVEQPAIGLFAELGWQTVSALEEIFGAPSPGLSATLSHPLRQSDSAASPMLTPHYARTTPLSAVTTALPRS